MELTKEQALIFSLISKAWEDETFKQELVKSPIAAIKKATGQTIKVPEGKTLLVRDQTNPSVIYINIPPEPKVDDIEMTEEQLESIAGGVDPFTFIKPVPCWPIEILPCFPDIPQTL
jgi:hypothetical protein